jgi:hypothetical protein
MKEEGMMISTKKLTCIIVALLIGINITAITNSAGIKHNGAIDSSCPTAWAPQPHRLPTLAGTVPTHRTQLGDRGHFYAAASGSEGTGLITFDLDGNVQWLCTNVTEFFTGSDFDSEGNWYAVTYTGGLYQIDPDNGYFVYIAYTIPLNSLVYDMTTGIWYACGYDTNYIDSLFTIDINTGETTFIGHFGTSNIMISLMCDTEGNMYSYDVLFGGDSHLYSIDKDTGEATAVGDMGHNYCYAQEGKFDRDTGILYLAANDLGMGLTYFATCDPQTAVVNILFVFSNVELDAFTAIYGNAAYYPHAQFTWTPPVPNPGETILFNASASYDYDGYITLYEWDWDSDGVYDESSASPTATHSWDNPGSYEVTLRVTDNSSLTGTIEHTVEVVSLPPPSPPHIYGPTEGIVHVSYAFYTDSITDPNGDMLYFMWDWGDGNITGWLGPYPSGQPITGSHSWTYAGKYGIRGRIKTSGGTSNWSEAHNITIMNATGPTAPIISGPTQGEAGAKYNYTFNSTDNTCDTLAYFIDWGDNTSSWISGHSGNETIANHTWSKRGTYTIRAKAKNCWDVESPWGTLPVTMPLTFQPPSFRFFAWLLARFPHAFPILHYLLGR